MRSTFKRILMILAAAVSITALLSLVLLLLGYRPFILESSSMEPLYHKGSLVWADTRVTAADLEPGSVVVYRSGGTVILHRYLGDDLIAGDVTGNPQEFDPATLVGRESFTIPLVGSVISWLLSIPWLLWILVAVLIILACVPSKKKSKSTMPTTTESKEGGIQ